MFLFPVLICLHTSNYKFQQWFTEGGKFEFAHCAKNAVIRYSPKCTFYFNLSIIIAHTTYVTYSKIYQNIIIFFSSVYKCNNVFCFKKLRRTFSRVTWKCVLMNQYVNMLRGRVGCLRQPTLPLSIRINTGSLYRNVSILNYKRDKDNVS